jgi:5'-nucleotidase (lipoprotein e(P4) family)
MKATKIALIKLFAGASVAASGLLLTGCSTHTPQHVADHNASPIVNQVVDQNMHAVLWLQNSGEYQALCHQAFNAAKAAVDQAKQTQSQAWAVMVDLDETMLDNSPYAAWMLLNQEPYTPSTWSKWCDAAEATALPGAVDFAQYVTSQGGALFYVSNRDYETLEVTMQNLRKLNFPEVNPSRVLLKTDSSNKAARLQQITDAGYQVVLLLGDNLNDFPQLATWHQNNADRKQITAINKSAFGQRFILLPNPTYGDWEGGMAPNYHELSDAEKLLVRRENLRAWSGE